MIIIFKSIINNNGQKKEIKFSSQVNISKFEEFSVYEFKEPSKNEMNRIEVSDDKINIMVGPSTIELELNTKISILYQIPGAGQLTFDTMLHKLDRNDHKIFFEYSLINKTKIIGNFKINLEIKN